MKKNIKFILLGILLFIAFTTGIWLLTAKNNHQHPTFSVNQKYVGQELNSDEQKLFDTISENNAKFISSLTENEKSLWDSLSIKVKEAVNKNSKIKIKYKKLLSKDESEVLRKVRKYRKEMRENHPVDKKIYSHMMKKLTQEQAMKLLLYIK